MAYNSLKQLRTNIETIRSTLNFQPGDRLDEVQLENLRAYSPGSGKVLDILTPGKTYLNEETGAQTIAYGKLMDTGLNEKARKKGVRI